MKGLWHDLRYAFRQLVRSPAYALPALAALALGIGATTLVISYAQATSLRLFAYRDALGILNVKRVAPSGQAGSVHSSTYVAWRDEATSLAEVAATNFTTANLTGVADPEPLYGNRITASLLPLLGIEPLVGRAFLESDERPGAEPVAMLSERLWRGRYGASPDVVGSTVRLNDTAFTVVGVMPRGYYGYGPISAFHDYWVPLIVAGDAPGRYLDRDRRNDALAVYARLKPGLKRRAALDELDRIAAGALAAEAAEDVSRRSEWKTSASSLYERVVDRDGQTLATFWCAAAGLLLIACVNVALMMLARGSHRRRELALRAALGAKSRRLVRQLLTESLLVAAGGGLAGVAVAYVALPAVVFWAPQGIRRSGLELMTVDATTLAAAVLVSALTACAFGLIPALRASRPDLNEALKHTAGGGSSSRRGRWIQDTLVAAAIGSSLALLIVSSLLAESFLRLRDVDPGYRTREILTARVPVPLYKYGESERGRFYLDVVERAARLPGAVSAAAAVPLPLGNIDTTTRFLLEGETPERTADMHLIRYGAVTDDFFSTLGVPLLAGRAFDRGDSADAPLAVIVNQAAAREYWPGENPLGKRVNFDRLRNAPWATVVGVVGGIRYRGLADELEPTLYRPVTQGLFGTFGMTLLVRASGDPLALAPAVREALSEVDPDAPLAEIRTMQDVVDASLAGRRHRALIVGLFSAFALALALVGVYGVVSYSVTRQTAEIGLRKALGARAADTARLVLGRISAVVAVGAAAGVGASLLLTELVRDQLFGVQAGDPSVVAVSIATLALGALAAAALPARRASRIEPTEALRHE